MQRIDSSRVPRQRSAPPTDHDPVACRSWDSIRHRHEDAARRLSVVLVGPGQHARVVVADAFADVRDALTAGVEAEGDARMTVLRAVRLAGSPRGPDGELHRPLPPDTDDEAVLRRTFAALPPRWRTVLWYVAVEQESPSDVAIAEGMTPASAAGIEERATAGFARGYLAAQTYQLDDTRCAEVHAHLRRSLGSSGDERPVPPELSEHLRTCDRCRQVAGTAARIHTDLGAVLGPLALGDATARYRGAPAEPARRARARRQVPTRPRRRWLRPLLVGVSVAVLAAAVTLAVLWWQRGAGSTDPAPAGPTGAVPSAAPTPDSATVDPTTPSTSSTDGPGSTGPSSGPAVAIDTPVPWTIPFTRSVATSTTIQLRNLSGVQLGARPVTVTAPADIRIRVTGAIGACRVQADGVTQLCTTRPLGTSGEVLLQFTPAATATDST
ncbi:MAG: hypothetical protein INR72_17040, partial [Williamsia herbipolensis]|nr:hypothetical protein [Williamsia herbipolensis]